MAGTVDYRVEGPVGWITLDRPAKLNALDRASLEALVAIVNRASVDPALRVLALTGRGRAFCAGADLAEVEGPGRDAYLDLLGDAFATLRGFPRPVLGVISGIAAAGGLELALCCDLLVAAESATFADAHIGHGLVPGGGAATLLPCRIGPQRAKQMLFLGGFESAATLRDWGLVNWVVPDADLGSHAAEILARLAALPADALAAMKTLADGQKFDEPLEREARIMRRHLMTETAAEGLAAFRDRRPPRFP